MKTLGIVLLWVVIVWLMAAVVIALVRKIGAWLSGKASFADDVVQGGRRMAKQAAQRAERAEREQQRRRG